MPRASLDVDVRRPHRRKRAAASATRSTATRSACCATWSRRRWRPGTRSASTAWCWWSRRATGPGVLTFRPPNAFAGRCVPLLRTEQRSRLRVCSNLPENSDAHSDFSGIPRGCFRAPATCANSRAEHPAARYHGPRSRRAAILDHAGHWHGRCGTPRSRGGPCSGACRTGRRLVSGLLARMRSTCGRHHASPAPYRLKSSRRRS